MSRDVRGSDQCIVERPYLNQWSNVLVLDTSLATNFVKPASVRTVSHRLILQIAFTTLIANRTVKGMVGEEEFHNTLTGFVYERRVCLDDHSRLDRPCTRRN